MEQPSQPEGIGAKEAIKTEKIALAREMIERGEIFPFPEVREDVYTKIKSEEVEFPGYTTPIDEIIAESRVEGIKVVLGLHPESGNVFILPATSNNIEQDSIAPRYLESSNVVSEDLKKLIGLDSQ